MKAEHAILTALSLPTIGRKRAVAAFLRWGTMGRAEGELATAFKDGQFFGRQFTDSELQSAQVEAHRILSSCLEHRIEVIGILSKAYPPWLRTIPDPPAVLFVRGRPGPLLRSGVAVVGTRNPRHGSLDAVREIVAALVAHRLPVISGLALGCDAAAHDAAVQEKGVTIAVLAHGLDMVRPASNRPLADRILETGGCLVSEYPPGTPAMPANFVERDRIQSGLAQAVVVIQTDIDGGSMHTARFAVEQGRLLATLAANGGPGFEGNAKILQSMGGIAIQGKPDVDELVRKIASSMAHGPFAGKSSSWGTLGRDVRR